MCTHEQGVLSRYLAAGESTMVTASLVAWFADGRTATLIYSQESTALLIVEELAGWSA
jgi:hypothetical protein